MRMRIEAHCRECTVRQAKDIVARATKDPSLRRMLEGEIQEGLRELGYEVTPPAYARAMLQVVYRHFGVVDLYQAEKDASTRMAQELAAALRPRVEGMADAFGALVRLAIGGNILDFGINDSLDVGEACRRMEEVFAMSVQESELAELRRRLENASRVLYILDNCGEAVFDAWLLKPYACKTTVGVRGLPVLNDVTRRELDASGFGGYPVVDTGDCTPGVLEEHSSAEFLEALEGADLVIAKGQGNIETLMSSGRSIFYLFRAKCPVIRDVQGGVEANSLQIVHLS